MIVVNPTGGGLSNGKLAQATATPADVLSGKTFFAGGREMQTGTLVPSGRIKTGSFYSFDEVGATLAIDCGFKPLMVIIDGGYTDNTSNGKSITYGYTYSSDSFISYTIYKEYAGASDQVIRNVVSITSSGFTVTNVAVGNDSLFYINRYYYYYAVG